MVLISSNYEEDMNNVAICFLKSYFLLFWNNAFKLYLSQIYTCVMMPLLQTLISVPVHDDILITYSGMPRRMTLLVLLFLRQGHNN